MVRQQRLLSSAENPSSASRGCYTLGVEYLSADISYRLANGVDSAEACQLACQVRLGKDDLQKIEPLPGCIKRP